MILRYGNFWHAIAEVGLTTQQRPVYSARGYKQFTRHTWNIQGLLQAESPSSLTAAVNAMQSAYSFDGFDAAVYLDHGVTLTHLVLASNATIGGVRVTQFDFPNNGIADAEYTTYRNFTIQLEADFPDTSEQLLSFTESLSFSGTGGPQDIYMKVLTDNLAIDSRVKPDALEFIAGPAKFQSRLKLGRPVGIEADGTIKHIDELSYKPPNGWAGENPQTFSGVTGDNPAETKRNRQLALQSVFRWYEVTTQADGSLEVPGSDEIVSEIKQVLPLGEGLISTYKDADGVLRPNEAIVRGVYFNEDHAYVNSPPGTVVDGDFRVDRERGIVKFLQPVLKLAFALSGVAGITGVLVNAPADLDIEISYNVRKLETRELVRFKQQRKLLNNSTKPQVVRNDEVARTVTAFYDTDADGNDTTEVIIIEENTSELKTAAETFLNIAQRELQTPKAADKEYAGIKRIELDGAIQQVAWSVGPSGATTRASRNTEFSLDVPKYSERRKDEQLRQQIEQSRPLALMIEEQDRKAARV